MTASNRLLGRRVEFRPYPCPLCGAMLDISDPLVLLGSCQACCGDLIVERFGERLAKLQHQRILKILEGATP